MPRHRPSERLARFRKRKRAGFPIVVSEGDSWFSYEFFPNIIDLLDDEELFAHLRLEMSGDTVANMAGQADVIESLRSIVRDEDALFVLFSGGGNDIQQSAARLFRKGPDADACVKDDVFETLFGTLRRQYENLIKAIGPVAPVVSHGYDWFQPSPEPVRFAGIALPVGPWIFPEMVAAEIDDPTLQRAIADKLVDRFNEDLAALQEAHPRDFIYIDLRDTLDPESDWENEIHPTRQGFRMVTDAIRDDIFTRVHRKLVERGAL